MMRGSLDKPRKKSAQQNLEKAHTKKARDGLVSSEGQTPADHGNQQGDANTNAIFLFNVLRDTSDKSKRSKLKPIRGSLDIDQCQATLKVGVQEDNTNMDVVNVPNMPSLDKTGSNPTKGHFERLMLKPLRRNFKKSERQEKLIENGEKGDTNMDAMSLPDMIRFLEMEETLLTQLQSKMSAELSRLQVEEHVFLHTLKILGQKHASINKDQPETSSGDQDLIDALNEALMENGESVPSNEEKGEGTSEE